MTLKAEISPEEQVLAARIAEAVRRAGGRAVISSATGISERQLSKYMAGDNSPSALVALKIAQACGVPVQWLLSTGDGDLSGHTSDQSGGTFSVPILDVSAGQGPALENGEVEVAGFVPFPEIFLRQLGITPAKARIITGRGDSMLPTIADGASALINVADRDLVDGRIYALRGPDGLQIKRVQRSWDGGVTLISDNKEIYPAVHISRNDSERLAVIGRVVWAEKLL